MDVVGVVIMVIRKSSSGAELLFLQRSGGKYEGQWWPVAGTCEAGENPVETVIRELREEVALIPQSLYPLGLTVPHVDGHSRLEGYVAYVEADAQVALNYEHSSFKWQSVEEALEIAPDPDFIRYVEREFMLVDQPKGNAIEF